MAAWKQNSEQHSTICTGSPLDEQDLFLPIYLTHLSTGLISMMYKAMCYPKHPVACM